MDKPQSFTYLRCVHTLIAYPEKAQRDLLYAAFAESHLLEMLTGVPRSSNTVEKEPVNGLFAFGYIATDEKPVYVYFRASTFGSPNTEYEQIREQASFIHRHADAYYFALLLREAWFEWADDYISRRLELPMRRIGYEEFLSAMEKQNMEAFSQNMRQELAHYRRHLQKEYEGILYPYRSSDARLRQYAALWHIRSEINAQRRNLFTQGIELDIRTQPHVHSSHLDQVFLRQHPAYRLKAGDYELRLFWELEKDGLFLRMWLPPMREKAARAVHTYIRKQAQAIIGDRFMLGRTRGTLKGIDSYHAREVNLIRIELPEMQEILTVRSAENFHALTEKLSRDLTDAINLLPAMTQRLQEQSLSVRIE